MFQRINEVGAKPFLLFQYYLTYATAPKINPSLKTVALDMGILDKKGNPQVSAICHLKKELIKAGWIKEIDGEIIITLEKISTEPLRKSQQPIEKISTESLENLNEPLRKSQSPYKEEKEQLEITKEEKNIYSAHETFSDESQITNDEHAAKIDETFVWLRQKKNLSRLPQSEWLALFTDLEAESITLDGFKEFYVWAESESWIVEKKVTLSPNVLRRMVEKYKNREHLEAKRKIQETKNGKNYQPNQPNISTNGAKRTNRDKLAGYSDIFAKYPSEKASDG